MVNENKAKYLPCPHLSFSFPLTLFLSVVNCDHNLRLLDLNIRIILIALIFPHSEQLSRFLRFALPSVPATALVRLLWQRHRGKKRLGEIGSQTSRMEELKETFELICCSGFIWECS